MKKLKRITPARTAMSLLLAFFVSTGMWATDVTTLTTFTGFTATKGSSGIGNHEGYASLVDGKFSSTNRSDWSKWCTNSKSLTEEGVSYYYVEFHHTTPIIVQKYILTTGDDNAKSDCYGRNPKSWKLQGKLTNDSKEPWTTIATVTNNTTMQNKNHEDYTFDVDAVKTFQYFRFLVSENRGGSCLQLSELRLQGQNVPIVEINNKKDWDAFTAKINNGAEFAYYKLTENISGITKTVGTKEHPFRGIFDGGGNTLIVNINETETEGTAPFREISHATIQNLKVEGNVVGTTHAAGLVGFTRGGENTIDNCMVSVNVINNATSGNLHIGGVVGHGCGDGNKGDNMIATTLTIKNTVFNGTLSNKGHYAGGLQGWSNGNTLTIENSLSTGTYNGKGAYHPIAIHNQGSTSTVSVKNTHYSVAPTLTDKKFIAATATPIYTEASKVPTDQFALLTEMADGKSYFVTGTATITNFKTTYMTLGGKAIPLSYSAAFNGTTLPQDSYTATITDSQNQEVTDHVTATGTYTLTLTGNGTTCAGKITANFNVTEGLAKGDGTAEKPYQIENIDDWNLFATLINSGNDNDAYYELTENISGITTMVGTDANRFKGYFNGNGNKLTLAISSTKDNAAPFSVIDGATITGLTVDGTIQSTKKYAAGLVGVAHNKTSITNCTSNVEIISDISNSDGDATYGGFAGRTMEDCILNIENCLFTGTIRDKDLDDRKTIKCAGFVGWCANTVNYKNCIQAGTISIMSTTATFQRCNNTKSTFKNSYYITASGDIQGTQARTTVPDDQIAKRYTLGENVYYLPGTEVKDIPTSFTYTTKTLTATPSVFFADEQLTASTDYTISYQKKNSLGKFEDVAEIRDAGEYLLKISGIGHYAGTYVSDAFSVIAIGSTWADLQEELNKGGLTILTQNYTAEADDAALSITKTVTLDLNGFTISRGLTEAVANGYVININTNGNLTITDSSEAQNGTITGGKNKGNGGGIYNKGTLTLEKGTITGNTCLKSDDSKMYGTGGGIYCEGSKNHFYMKGGAVNGNTAQGGGGGIHVKDSKTCDITGGEVKDNTTGSKGGGIRVSSTSNATISNCVITGNKATDSKEGKGGGIYMEEKVLTLTDCTISGNSAKVEGGAIYSMKVSTITANNCTITNNEAPKGGAVSLYADSKGTSKTTYIMNGGIYTGNTSTNTKAAKTHVYSGSTFDVALANNAPNVITDLNQCTPSSITLAGRTLYKDGDWNTLCLPFSIDDISTSPLAGADIRQLSTASLTNGTLTLNFTAEGAVTAITAGTPYLIKWAAGTDLTESDLVFTGATLSTETHNFTSTDGKVQFIGVISPTDIYSTAHDNYYLGASNKLYYPEAEGMTSYTVKACRAYFHISNGEENDIDARRINNFSISFGDDSTTAIDAPLNGHGEKTNEDVYYNLNGQRVSAPAKGIYVKNGAKVLIK